MPNLHPYSILSQGINNNNNMKVEYQDRKPSKKNYACSGKYHLCLIYDDGISFLKPLSA